MDYMGFTRFLESQGLEANTVENYMRIIRILETDCKQLTGKGIDDASMEDVETCLADYNRRLRTGSYNFYVITARKYLLGYREKARARVN